MPDNDKVTAESGANETPQEAGDSGNDTGGAGARSVSEPNATGAPSVEPPRTVDTLSVGALKEFADVLGGVKSERTYDELASKLDTVSDALAKLIEERTTDSSSGNAEEGAPKPPEGTPQAPAARVNGNGKTLELGPEHVPNNLQLYPNGNMNEQAQADIHALAKRVAAGETSLEEEMAFTQWFKETFLPAQHAYRTNAPMHYTRA